MLLFSSSSGSGASDEPDLLPVKEVVSDRVWRALIDSSRELDRLGIQHALVGGLAVGSYGYVRATSDVDFLVSDTAFVNHPSGIVTLVNGLPIKFHDVRVDYLSADNEDLLEALDDSLITEGVPVVPWEVLVYLKLKAGRSQDRSDIVRLLEQGADVDSVRTYLYNNHPKLLARFDRWVIESEGEP